MTQPEQRSPTSLAFQWASRISTVGLEFALPPLAGVYVDQRWTPSPLGVLIGVVLGFTVGMLHILKIAREGTKS